MMGLMEAEERRGDDDMELRGSMGETSGLETRWGEAEGSLLRGLGKLGKLERTSLEKLEGMDGEDTEGRVRGDEGRTWGEDLLDTLGVLMGRLRELWDRLGVELIKLRDTLGEEVRGRLRSTEDVFAGE